MSHFLVPIYFRPIPYYVDPSNFDEESSSEDETNLASRMLRVSLNPNAREFKPASKEPVKNLEPRTEEIKEPALQNKTDFIIYLQNIIAEVEKTITAESCPFEDNLPLFKNEMIAYALKNEIQKHFPKSLFAFLISFQICRSLDDNCRNEIFALLVQDFYYNSFEDDCPLTHVIHTLALYYNKNFDEIESFLNVFSWIALIENKTCKHFDLSCEEVLSSPLLLFRLKFAATVFVLEIPYNIEKALAEFSISFDCAEVLEFLLVATSQTETFTEKKSSSLPLTAQFDQIEAFGKKLLKSNKIEEISIGLRILRNTPQYEMNFVQEILLKKIPSLIFTKSQETYQSILLQFKSLLPSILSEDSFQRILEDNNLFLCFQQEGTKLFGWAFGRDIHKIQFIKNYVKELILQKETFKKKIGIELCGEIFFLGMFESKNRLCLFQNEMMEILTILTRDDLKHETLIFTFNFLKNLSLRKSVSNDLLMSYFAALYLSLCKKMDRTNSDSYLTICSKTALILSSGNTGPSHFSDEKQNERSVLVTLISDLIRKSSVALSFNLMKSSLQNNYLNPEDEKIHELAVEICTKTENPKEALSFFGELEKLFVFGYMGDPIAEHLLLQRFVEEASQNDSLESIKLIRHNRATLFKYPLCHEFLIKFRVIFLDYLSTLCLIGQQVTMLELLHTQPHDLTKEELSRLYALQLQNPKSEEETYEILIKIDKDSLDTESKEAVTKAAKHLILFLMEQGNVEKVLKVAVNLLSDEPQLLIDLIKKFPNLKIQEDKQDYCPIIESVLNSKASIIEKVNVLHLCIAFLIPFPIVLRTLIFKMHLEWFLTLKDESKKDESKEISSFVAMLLEIFKPSELFNNETTHWLSIIEHLKNDKKQSLTILSSLLEEKIITTDDCHLFRQTAHNIIKESLKSDVQEASLLFSKMAATEAPHPVASEKSDVQEASLLFSKMTATEAPHPVASEKSDAQEASLLFSKMAATEAPHPFASEELSNLRSVLDNLLKTGDMTGTLTLLRYSKKDENFSEYFTGYVQAYLNQLLDKQEYHNWFQAVGEFKTTLTLVSTGQVINAVLEKQPSIKDLKLIFQLLEKTMPTDAALWKAFLEAVKTSNHHPLKLLICNLIKQKKLSTTHFIENPNEIPECVALFMLFLNEIKDTEAIYVFFNANHLEILKLLDKSAPMQLERARLVISLLEKSFKQLGIGSSKKADLLSNMLSFDFNRYFDDLSLQWEWSKLFIEASSSERNPFIVLSVSSLIFSAISKPEFIPFLSQIVIPAQDIIKNWTTVYLKDANMAILEKNPEFLESLKHQDLTELFYCILYKLTGEVILKYSKKTFFEEFKRLISCQDRMLQDLGLLLYKVSVMNIKEHPKERNPSLTAFTDGTRNNELIKAAFSSKFPSVFLQALELIVTTAFLESLKKTEVMSFLHMVLQKVILISPENYITNNDPILEELHSQSISYLFTLYTKQILLHRKQIPYVEYHSYFEYFKTLFNLNYTASKECALRIQRFTFTSALQLYESQHFEIKSGCLLPHAVLLENCCKLFLKENERCTELEQFITTGFTKFFLITRNNFIKIKEGTLLEVIHHMTDLLFSFENQVWFKLYKLDKIPAENLLLDFIKTMQLLIPKVSQKENLIKFSKNIISINSFLLNNTVSLSPENTLNYLTVFLSFTKYLELNDPTFEVYHFVFPQLMFKTNNEKLLTQQQTMLHELLKHYNVLADIKRHKVLIVECLLSINYNSLYISGSLSEEMKKYVSTILKKFK